MKTAVFRKANFNSAHRLHNPNWDEKTNTEVFGLCNNPHYHGHNYDLIVKLVGEVDEETGYLFDLKILNDLIKSEIIDRFDHKNLNLAAETLNSRARCVVGCSPRATMKARRSRSILRIADSRQPHANF